MSLKAEERIAESFNLYFSAWDIRVAPGDVVIGSDLADKENER